MWVGLTVVLLGVAAYLAYRLYHVIDDQQAVGIDLGYYQFVAQRWLDTGVFYAARQLDGHYEVRRWSTTSTRRTPCTSSSRSSSSRRSRGGSSRWA